MPVRARPLSPHLQIYRWQISNTLSILHRVSGAGLSLGLLALAYWLMAIAAGPAPYHAASGVFTSAPGILVLIAWAFAFSYHFLNGIRHLFWDVGLGFERTQSRASGWAVVAGALLCALGLIAMFWRLGRA